MELTQLYYFKVAAEQEHFRKASELLHITQPTLSQTIARLESELGVALFERSGKYVYLNDFGKEFLGYVRHALVFLDDGKKRIQQLCQGDAGEVRFGITIPEMISIFLPAYLNQHPEVHIHQSYGTAAQLQEMLEKRELDFAITIFPIETIDIDYEPVLEEEIGILVSTLHRFASRSSVCIDELKNEKFIVNNMNADLSEHFFSFFAQAGIEPNVIFEGDQSSLIEMLVRQNIGVSVSSIKRHQTMSNKNIHFLSVEDRSFSRTVGFAKLRNKPFSPAAELFFHYLKRALATGEGLTYPAVSL